MEYKIFLGYLATFVALVSYVPYFKDIFIGKTKPHAFSWFIWGLLNGIVFLVQFSENAGAGAWVTGFTALACFAIAILAYSRGYRDFPTLDWFFLLSALLALFFWYITVQPLISIILITVADGLGFIPTIRKAFYKPFEETVSLYVLSGIKFFISIFALQSFTLVTWLFPAFWVVVNTSFVTMLLVRRKTFARRLHNHHYPHPHFEGVA